jgi:hypothetical protein
MTRATSALIIAGLTMMAVTMAPTPAVADRPGTPNAERAYECWGFYTVEKQWAQRPAICVEFTNTASELVKFDIGTSLNGATLPNGAMRDKAGCMVPATTKYTCIAGFNLAGVNIGTQTGHPFNWNALTLVVPGVQIGAGMTYLLGNDEIKRLFTEQKGGDIARQGFLVKDLEWDANYCFRFKARRMSDDMVSEQWSNWACAHTSAQPAKPVKPPPPEIKFFPAQWDGTSHNKPLPNRIVISPGPGTLPPGQRPPVTSATMSVKTIPPQYANQIEIKKGAVGGTFEVPPSLVNGTTLIPNVGASFCETNISGTTCSEYGWSFKPGIESDRKGPGLPSNVELPGNRVDETRRPRVPIDVTQKPPPASDQLPQGYWQRNRARSSDQ